jgi:hypothetical protein
MFTNSPHGFSAKLPMVGFHGTFPSVLIAENNTNAPAPESAPQLPSMRLTSREAAFSKIECGELQKCIKKIRASEVAGS